MTNRDPESNFFKGFTRLPFHTLTLMVIILLFGTGLIPEGEAQIAVAALAGAILAPFYNSLADFLYIRVDRILSDAEERIPQGVWIASAVLMVIPGIALIILSWVFTGLSIETGLLGGLWFMSLLQTIIYVMDS